MPFLALNTGSLPDVMTPPLLQLTFPGDFRVRFIPAPPLPRRSIPFRMARNNARETATSAIWKTTCRECRTTFAASKH